MIELENNLSKAAQAVGQDAFVVESVDYNAVTPLPSGQVLTMVTHFITRTVDFLNNFSHVCEEKLADVDHKMQTLSISTNLLEAKLTSIYGLDCLASTTEPQTDHPSHSEQPQPQPQQPQPQQQQPINNTSTFPAPPPPPPPNASALGEETPKVPPRPSVAEVQITTNLIKVSEDPRYKEYFNMLKYKVPVVQIKQRMEAHGVDPSIIDNPDAPAPPADTPADTTPAEKEENAVETEKAPENIGDAMKSMRGNLGYKHDESDDGGSMYGTSW